MSENTNLQYTLVNEAQVVRLNENNVISNEYKKFD